MPILRCWLLAALIVAPAASAQGLFWLVDFNDQFIGEVAGVDINRPFVAIPAPDDGEPVFVPFVANGGDPGPGYTTIYFEGISCNPPAYIQTTLNTPAQRVGVWANSSWLWATTRSGLVQISSQSHYNPDFSCTSTAPTLFFARQVVEFVPPLTFTPPVRVIRNPNALLQDRFELGNTSHWSSSAPAVAAGAAPSSARDAE